MTDMRITIWDKNTQIVLKTIVVPFVWSEAPVKHKIESLKLSKGQEYFISMSTNSWYKHQKEDNTDATYPITVGNISITGYATYTGAEQIMPTAEGFNRYSGDVGFYFVRTN